MSEFIVQFVILVMFGCNSSCNVYRNRRMIIHFENLYKFDFRTPLLCNVRLYCMSDYMFHVMFCSYIQNFIQSKWFQVLMFNVARKCL